MRDAAGEGADAFHALGAHELGLDFFLFGDVGVDDEDRSGVAIGVAHQGVASFQNELLSGLGEVPDFAGPSAFFEGGQVEFLEHFRWHLENVGEAPAEGLLARPAVDALGSLVPEEDAAFEVAFDDGVLRLIEEGGLFGDAVLGFFALGDVFLDGDKMGDVAQFVDDGRDAGQLAVKFAVFLPV